MLQSRDTNHGRVHLILQIENFHIPSLYHIYLHTTHTFNKNQSAKIVHKYLWFQYKLEAQNIVFKNHQMDYRREVVCQPFPENIVIALSKLVLSYAVLFTYAEIHLLLCLSHMCPVLQHIECNIQPIEYNRLST